MKAFYVSIEQLLKDWPIFDYTKEELEKISQLAKERKEELTIRIWGREYATFYPDGGVIPFEYEEINDNGSLKPPPKNDKGVIYEFQFVGKGNFFWKKRKVKEKVEL